MVLVHGAWHDERCWSDVTAQLDVLGVPWATLTLPSTDPGGDLPGFADDVAAVVERVEAVGGEVTLCGHGYGGMVISEVGNLPQVTRLVYLAAFCPCPGESALDLSARVSPGGPLLLGGADGRMRVGASHARRALYGDLGRVEAAAKASLLLPSTASIYRARATSPAWQTKETTYVLCRRDRVIRPRRARRMANRVVRTQIAHGRAATHLAVLDTGHSPFFSAPGHVAALLSNRSCVGSASVC